MHAYFCLYLLVECTARSTTVSLSLEFLGLVMCNYCGQLKQEFNPKYLVADVKLGWLGQSKQTSNFNWVSILHHENCRLNCGFKLVTNAFPSCTLLLPLRIRLSSMPPPQTLAYTVQTSCKLEGSRVPYALGACFAGVPFRAFQEVHENAREANETSTRVCSRLRTASCKSKPTTTSIECNSLL